MVSQSGSLFTDNAESRYAPGGVEALAIAEALEKCRPFVFGCQSLIIATVHKLLLKFFDDRELCDIKNARIFQVKEKTLMYRFKLVYVPGLWHAGHLQPLTFVIFVTFVTIATFVTFVTFATFVTL